MVVMANRRRSSHRDRTVEVISRYTGQILPGSRDWADCGTSHHPPRARATDRLYQEDHSMEDDQVSMTLTFGSRPFD